MTDSRSQKLNELFNEADVGWVFSQEPESTAKRILQEMDEMHSVLNERQFIPIKSSILEQISLSSQGYKPLIQSFASPMSAEIRAMVYCILNGGEIISLECRYKRKSSSYVKVELEMPSGESLLFKSKEFWDFEALRHFGMMKVGGKPILDGYFSFKYNP